MAYQAVIVSARCRTASGRQVGMIAPVAPSFYEDAPVLRAYCLATLRPVADGEGDTLDDATLTIQARP